MVVFVAVFHWGAVGLVVGNFVGTLCVYARAASSTAASSSTSSSTGRSSGRCRRFGMPLVPSALALWAINFIDREFVSYYKGDGEVGIYSVAIKIGSVVTFVVLAFRTAWPAFAYSIEDDRGRAPRLRLRAHLRAHRRLLDLARPRRARALARRLADRTRATTAPRRASRCSPSPSPSTRATPCSRSGAAARGGRR